MEFIEAFGFFLPSAISYSLLQFSIGFCEYQSKFPMDSYVLQDGTKNITSENGDTLFGNLTSAGEVTVQPLTLWLKRTSGG